MKKLRERIQKTLDEERKILKAFVDRDMHNCQGWVEALEYTLSQLDLAEKKDDYVIATFELHHGEFESVDRLVFTKERATTYGEDKSKNHAELIDAMYTIADDDWRHGEVKYAHKDWIDVMFADGIARVRSIEPISNSDVDTFSKHGWAGVVR